MKFKFRGKTRDKWVYGSLVESGEKRLIVQGKNFVEVDPATVGMYTGFRDADGKEIYQGDIVMLETKDTEEGWERFRGVVVWEDGCFWVQAIHETFSFARWCLLKDAFEWYDVKVTGNLFDKPVEDGNGKGGKK